MSAPQRPVAAVTLDFWDTLAIDDSDELRRQALGLPSKPVARRQLFVQEVLAHHPEVPEARAAEAFQTCTDWFRRCWKVDHHTPTVAERLDVGLADLAIERTPGFDALVHALERMEVDLPPEPVEGLVEGLTMLADRWPLAIISDAIVTPGRGLREILERWEVLHLFRAFVFSDEVGASKPAPRVFEEAAERLGAPLTGLVHVGDRESNDVIGPHGVGARAVLFTGAVDRGSAATAADAVCARFDELPAVVAELQS